MSMTSPMYIFVVCDDNCKVKINGAKVNQTLDQFNCGSSCWTKFGYYYVENVTANDSVTVECQNWCGPGGMNISYIWNKSLYTLPNNGMEGIANIINYQATGAVGWSNAWVSVIPQLLPWMKNYIRFKDAPNCNGWGSNQTYMTVTFNVGSSTNNNIFSKNLWCYLGIDDNGYVYINNKLVYTKSQSWNVCAQFTIPNVNPNDSLYIQCRNGGGPGGVSLTYVYQGMISSLPSYLPGFNNVINNITYTSFGLVGGYYPGGSVPNNLIFNGNNWLNSCGGACNFGITTTVMGSVIPPTSCAYQMSSTELQCYKNNYPEDLTNMNNTQLQNHWSTTGCKQGRNNQCASQQTSSGLYNYKGCYNDTGIRAIPTYQTNVSSVNQCAQIAESKNQNVFGVQYGGQCFTGLNKEQAYQYGANFNKASCPTLGGAWTNQVYVRSNSFPSPSAPVPYLTNPNFASKENFENILDEEERDENVKNIFKYIIIAIIIILLFIFISRMLRK